MVVLDLLKPISELHPIFWELFNFFVGEGVGDVGGSVLCIGDRVHCNTRRSNASRSSCTARHKTCNTRTDCRPHTHILDIHPSSAHNMQQSMQTTMETGRASNTFNDTRVKLKILRYYNE